jgi:outer membrane protein OmpA-like peptidoglycan-associated protein
LSPGGRFHLDLCLPQPGVHGVILLHGKGPFDLRLPPIDATAPMAVPADFAGRFAEAARARGWRAQAVWLEVAPAQVATAPPQSSTPEAGAYASRTFILYFAADQASLTPQAEAVLREAASYALAGRARRIDVVGYSDESDPDTAREVSEHRAVAIGVALAGLGVPMADIDAEGRGAASLVATPPDPLNSRVTIQVVF